MEDFKPEEKQQENISYLSCLIVWHPEFQI